MGERVSVRLTLPGEQEQRKLFCSAAVRAAEICSASFNSSYRLSVPWSAGESPIGVFKETSLFGPKINRINYYEMTNKYDRVSKELNGYGFTTEKKIEKREITVDEKNRFNIPIYHWEKYKEIEECHGLSWLDVDQVSSFVVSNELENAMTRMKEHEAVTTITQQIIEWFNEPLRDIQKEWIRDELYTSAISVQKYGVEYYKIFYCVEGGEKTPSIPFSIQGKRINFQEIGMATLSNYELGLALGLCLISNVADIMYDADSTTRLTSIYGGESFSTGLFESEVFRDNYITFFITIGKAKDTPKYKEW